MSKIQIADADERRTVLFQRLFEAGKECVNYALGQCDTDFAEFIRGGLEADSLRFRVEAAYRPLSVRILAESARWDEPIVLMVAGTDFADEIDIGRLH